MEIDATDFWVGFDKLLKSKSITLRKVCELAKLSYGTITQNKYRNVYPLISNLIPISTVLGVSLDELILGHRAGDQNPAVVNSDINNPRLQSIVTALIASPEKLSAIETLLGVAHPAGQSNLA